MASYIRNHVYARTKKEKWGFGGGREKRDD